MKLLIINNDLSYLVNFRGNLINDLVKRGHQVLACAPNSDTELEKKLADTGAVYKKIPFRNTGINPFVDLVILYKFYRVIKDNNPDVVLLYTIKPVIYGSISSRIAGVKKVVSTITGLGYVFIGDSLKNRLVRYVASFLYRISFRFNKLVFFQNKDDFEFFVEKNILSSLNKSIVIDGSGVDIEKYPFSNIKDGIIRFLFVGRLIKDKGLMEFYTASKILKNKYPEVEFGILGPFHSNPSAITPHLVDEWCKTGIVKYYGETDDVRPYLKNCSVFVLPSYREGTPRSSLEAMATGRPIVTTDVPGCRETVINGYNGFLVPLKDALSLSQAMEKFIVDPCLMHAMGKSSRDIAVNRYNDKHVNCKIINEIEAL